MNEALNVIAIDFKKHQLKPDTYTLRLLQRKDIVLQQRANQNKKEKDNNQTKITKIIKITKTEKEEKKKKKEKEKIKNYESVKKEAEQMDTNEGGSASVNNVQKSKRIQLNQILYQSLYDNNMPAALNVLEHDFNTTLMQPNRTTFKIFSNRKNIINKGRYTKKKKKKKKIEKKKLEKTLT